MASKPYKGPFVPKNRFKYIGHNIDGIVIKSSWELSVCMEFDSNPYCLAWAYECLPSNHVHRGISGIPYLNPFLGRWSIYIPDFFVIYVKPKSNSKHAEVIEVKPLDEVPPIMSGIHAKVSKLKEARQILNAAKYAAAIEFCSKRGWYFRLWTEKELFAFQR